MQVNSGMWADGEVCGPGDLTASVELLTDVFQKILLHLSMQVGALNKFRKKGNK